jgi:cation transport protein ChaC
VDFWVFAYGSLMWRPNFVYEEKSHALLQGAHRALCVYSVVHRGVHSAPGLVLGLDKGGRCEGIVFRVPKHLVQDTRLYLRRRENMTNTYDAVKKPVKLLDASGRTVSALCFLVNRHHPQYAGDLPLEMQAYLVRRSTGASGANIDYVINTVEHLRELGVHDGRLEHLMALLGHSLVKEKWRHGQASRNRPYAPFGSKMPRAAHR